MSRRAIVWVIVILIFGILLGWITSRIFTEKEKIIIEKVDTVFERKQIDSLITVIKYKDVEIDSLKNNVKVIREIQYKEKEKIKTLPVSEGVELLRDNLLSYGTESLPEDTLPKEYVVNLDTVVMINDRNLIDINSAYSDLKAEIDINNEFRLIIEADSTVREAQEEIIENKNSIISKQNTNITSLEKALKKEKRKKTRNTILVGALAVFLGALNLIH